MSLNVSKIINLPGTALKFSVENEDEYEPIQEFKSMGGVLSNNEYSWIANGPYLEVIETRTGNKIGSWTFGWVLKDNSTKIACVDEIQRPRGKHSILIVGVNSDISGGMICIFDFMISKVLRAIYVKDKITAIHVVDAGYNNITLPGPLRNFDGIIAIGTAGGDVHLIDICRPVCDEALTVAHIDKIRDELDPCELYQISVKDISKLEHHKQVSVNCSQHLAVHLNVVFNKSTEHFILKGPKGDDRIHANKEEVTVSALYYCAQLGSLLVGYNFGALQLYNLMSFELVYTSPVYEEHIPVTHFAVEEPADDPRAFCYIWAVYSPNETCQPHLPFAVMYAFCYHTKEYHEGYGYLYQDFNTAAVHFQMELGVPKMCKNLRRPQGGYCLKLNSIQNKKEGPNYNSNEVNVTLSIFIWSVWYTNGDTSTFLALFDLNQWYKEQMPRILDPQFSSTYMVQFSLNDLINSATNKNIPVLDIHVNEKSLQQFQGAQRLEEYYYPNSISFDMCCLRETDLIFIQSYGVQKALLAQIESLGPSCLIEPAEIFQQIVHLGLVPLFIDLAVDFPVSSNQQREIILGTALENQLISWLCKCASELANGSFLAVDCSLDMFISWAFQRAIALKSCCDNFCVPLFDHSGINLDSNTTNLLNNCIRQLNQLCSIYSYVIKKLLRFISNSELVEQQFRSLQMVSEYYRVLQWFLNVGLLPECPLNSYPRSDEFDRIYAPYPSEMLNEFYNHRRTLLKINSNEETGNLLFIDNFLEEECGGKVLQEQWRMDGGNGLYPPPSLQSLLRTYLIDNVDVSYKHLLTMYVFLDLAMTLDQERYKSVVTYLIKFPAVFKVSPSTIKIIQAFWQLDHGDYNTAMGLILDPLVYNKDLSDWHHRVILKSLRIQKQFNFALLYIQVRKPAMKNDEDVMSVISLYVANNMVDEAFYFLNRSSNASNEDKFLHHLFNECTKYDKLKLIIYRCLSTKEEDLFLKYLKDSKESASKDLLIYYNILRSRFIEAFDNHDCKAINNQGLKGQEGAIFREKLVNCLKNSLPDVNKNLIESYHKERNHIFKPVVKSTPMSVFVLNENENIQYKSTLVAAALVKAKQTFNAALEFKPETEATPFLRTPKAFSETTRISQAIINFTNVDTFKSNEPSSPTPAKRLKLSPRQSRTPLISTPLPSKLDTPIVKRKALEVYQEEKPNVVTPQSILKVKTSMKEKEFMDDFETFEKVEYTPVSSEKRSGLGLTPRKSLNKSIVRFENVKNSSYDSEITTPTQNSSLISDKKSYTSNENSLNTSKDSSKDTSAEEVFYSPESSFEEDGYINKVAKTDTSSENIKQALSATKAALQNTEFISKDETKDHSGLVHSPKSRRSYKRSLNQGTPIRCSPRLQNSTAENNSPSSPMEVFREPVVLLENISKAKTNVSSSSSNTDTSSSRESLASSPTALPKLRPRRSLCRQVLESNALNRVLDSKSHTLEVVTKVSRQTTKLVRSESSLQFQDGEEVHELNSMEKHEVATSMSEEKSDVSDMPELLDSIFSETNVSSVFNTTVVEETMEVDRVFDSITEQEEILKVQDEVNINETNITEPNKLEEIKNDKSEDIKINQFSEVALQEEEKQTKSVETYDQSVDSDQLEPEMSIFEISDDPFVAVTEQEVILEENNLCDDQSNILCEIVEENSPTSAASLSSHEKNIFDEILSNKSSSSDQSSSIELEERNEENLSLRKTNSVAEIIEINSSSDDDKNEVNRCSSSQFNDNDEHREVGYEKNIYDSLEESSNSDSELPFSSTNRSSCSDLIGEVRDVTQHQNELFYGDIMGEDLSCQWKRIESSDNIDVEDESDNSEEKTVTLNDDKSQIYCKNDETEDGERKSKEAESDNEYKEQHVEYIRDTEIVKEKSEEARKENEEVNSEEIELGNKEMRIDPLEKEKEKAQEQLGRNEENIKEMTGKKEEIVKEVGEKKLSEVEKINISNDKKEEQNEDVEGKVKNLSNEINESKLDISRETQTETKPRKRRTRASSASLLNSSGASVTTRRSLRRAASVEIDINLKPISETNLDDNSESKTPPTLRFAPLTRKQRSASVDESLLCTQQTTQKSRKSRAASVSRLAQISEEDSEGDNNRVKKAKTVIEDYSSSRRITRRQVTMLQKTLNENNKQENIDLAFLDPIVLLDRPSFEGNPDPEEKKVYETSPSTTNSTSSTHGKPVRRLRSASQISEHASSEEKEIALTPKRKMNLRRTSVDRTSDLSTHSTKNLKRKRNDREKSEDPISPTPATTTKSTSVISDKDGVFKTKEIIEKENNEESGDDVVFTRVTRSRAKSVTSDKTNISETSGTTRSRTVATSSRKLPDIEEESNAEKHSLKRRTRKGSSTN